jgi:hypothetical protein
LERFVENRAELLELDEDVQELTSFYTTQKHSWEQLRSAIQALSQNRLELEVHQTAGPAFARMEEILRAPRPYAMLHEVAALKHTAHAVNDQLVAAARGPVTMEIQGLLAGVIAEVDKSALGDALKTNATHELNKLLVTVASAAGIAHIAQARQTAEGAYDRALTVLEQASMPPLSAATVNGAPESTSLSASKLRKRRIVDAKALWLTGFIETPADVDTYLAKLRAALMTAIEANERVQIK